jgi:hypothetical protein
VRVATEQRVVAVEPGATVDLVVDVVNTGDLIDGITAQLIGLPGATTTVEPKVLPLFPSASGQIRLTVEVPATQPAGSHPVTVEVVSHGAGAVTQHVDIDLSVSARPGVRLGRTPQTVRSRRSGRFVLDVENTGNTALDVSLDAFREDTRTAARFSPEKLRVEPGTTVPAILVLKGPRMITGAEVDRTATINLTARRTNVISAMQETEAEPELEASTVVVLRQRPVVSRGLLTALVLMCIVGLWAAVFLLGLTQVLSGDPLTKTAPASFFPASAATGTDAQPAAAGEPAGAMPKDGLLPPGVGGSITGTVTAASNKLPVGRILVSAFREGSGKPSSSAATQSDGTFSLEGLFPTSYRLRFSATGFKPIWYPASTARAKATKVAVTAQAEAAGINAVVRGKPATITGTIDPGSSLTPVVTQVSARPLDILTKNGRPAGVAATVTSDATGAYTLTGLPAPATYELTFEAAGYAVKKVTTTVSGGEQRLQPSVIPASAEGRIAGLVTDGTTALGGVTVSTTVNGETVAVVTPTLGTVGTFSLGNLPTPGTYVVTFTAEGHGSDTQIIDLAAGQAVTDVKARLVEGTGSISGLLTGPDGEGLGGATVTVGGAADATGDPATATGTATDGTTGTTTAPTVPSTVPTTTTITDGDQVGRFTISGLQAPGEYTLTFTLDGYSPQSIPVRLKKSGPTQGLEVALTTRLGQLTGVVQQSSGAAIGVAVTASNGLETWTTTTGSAVEGGGLRDGGYRLDGLPPGSYHVTVTAPGKLQQTALVRIMPGVTTRQNLYLRTGG